MARFRPMGAEQQPCSEPGCTSSAAFQTRTKPAWCDDHITFILRAGGLDPLEPFTKSKAYRLTRCLRCGCEAHYRLEYVLDQLKQGVATCRACFWRAWGANQRSALHGYVAFAPVELSAVKAHAEANGYEYLGPLTDPPLPHDPHRVKCVYCGHIVAKREGDIGWGCPCQTNPRRETQPASQAKAGVKRVKDLLRNSDSPALNWWDHDANDPKAWDTVTVKASREVSWRCPECDLTFTERVLDMAVSPSCPDCSAQRAAEWADEYEMWKRTPVSVVAGLAEAWADEHNPSAVMVADHLAYKFRCPEGHLPRVSPLRFHQNGCPSCQGNATRRARLERVEQDPDTHAMNREIASQWHPDRNGPVKLETVPAGSRRTVWWKCWECSHEWHDTPAAREKRQRLRCPQCRTILDSLAYHFPELGEEWSPDNPLSSWQVRPSGKSAFVPKWVCSNNPTHVWTASLASRAAGAGCPECRESGKSRVELDHHAAAERVFGRAASGEPVEHEAFVRRGRWLVDITTQTASGMLVAIEYDGSYWHAGKADIDTAKSLDLLAAGYLVVRLREHPLLPLHIENPRYVEFTVHATAPDPDGVIESVAEWAKEQSAAADGDAVGR